MQKLTLNQIASELNKLWFAVDADYEGDVFNLPAEDLERLTTLGEKLPEKVDNWIQFLEALTAEAAVYEERKKKAAKLQKRTENMLQRLNNYLINMIETNPSMDFSGTLGTLKIKQNPPSLKHDLPTRRWSNENIVSDDMLAERPWLGDFVEPVTVMVLKTADLKDACKRGATYPSAGVRLERSKTIRW